jgi:transcriptional regulator with XRE-family HTH domain
VSRLTFLLGKQIAYFRRKADLTQEQLAEKTGYSVDFIGLVERGVNAPTVARLQDIADVLGVEVWELFKATSTREGKTHARAGKEGNAHKTGRKHTT